MFIEGIRSIGAVDIDYARELGFRIKLLAIAQAMSNGVEQRVRPCVVLQYTPTVSAVVVDHVDMARGDILMAVGVPVESLTATFAVPMVDHRGAYYVRLMVLHNPGVMADVAAILRVESVSLELIAQSFHPPLQGGAQKGDAW